MRSCSRELSHPDELPDCPTSSETAPSQIPLPLAERAWNNSAIAWPRLGQPTRGQPVRDLARELECDSHILLSFDRDSV
jgi:hypothetical protein